MLREFYLSFKDTENDTNKYLKHIQYNYIKHLSKFKYVSYKRIDITIESGSSNADRFDVEWDDGRTAKVSLIIDQSKLVDITSIESVDVIYSAISICLIELWKKNKWNSSDIQAFLDEVKKEKYFVNVVVGKSYSSPDKKHKGEFSCDIFPEYADYYLQINENRSTSKKKIKFLKGTPVIDLFFAFFNSSYWRDDKHFILHDFNKEIFYVFYIDDVSFTIEYRPLHNSQKQLENYVEAYGFKVSANERLHLLGLKS